VTAETYLFEQILPAVAADDSIPSRTDSRAVILAAITRAAAEHKGLVHISYVRPYLTPLVNPHMVGAVFAGLHLTGHLRATGRYMPNGGTGAGNGSKPAKLSRLTKPIGVAA